MSDNDTMNDDVPSRLSFTRVTLYGRQMLMPSDHALPIILSHCPYFGEPLALTVQAIAKTPVRVIDVGANIGDTVALIEERNPGKCVFLCIEAEDEFAFLCRRNMADNPRVQLEQWLISDVPGTIALERTKGTAIPRVSETGLSAQAAVRTVCLDEAAAGFVAAHSGVDLIKIDTDGFDFKVLRSAAGLLQQYFPLVFFELHPALWEIAREDCVGAFDYLASLRYEHFVFFTNRGIVYSQTAAPSRLFLETLINLARNRRHIDDFHYDVLAGDPETCRRAAEFSLLALRSKTTL